ncbi:MAG: primosomal protein N' [Candidatus Omnitrophica bacterium CG1_02_46_14]|nr:MAG: primosomal protein N' [Candidatus Omnitrophica bacterium CG1_02_46_14]
MKDEGCSTYADIALAFPSKGTFQYAVPKNLTDQIAVGKRVFISVRNRVMVGYVVGLSSEKVVAEIRDLNSVIDEAPILSAQFLALTKWIADYYLCSWGQAIEAALPAPFKKGKFFMKSRSKKMNVSPEVPVAEAFQMTPHQTEAYEKILAALKARMSAKFLLHGITGSGKTEVYMCLVRELLKESRGSIVLVPEISLTPQAVERFSKRFGEGLAVIHSRLSQARRVETWHRIRKGEAKVVVGARSAIFSPVKDLGLIVIDEEHDTSYKQEETPRYETRRVAAKRAELENSVLLMGSATPSLESYFESLNGGSIKISLPERIEKRPLPEVEIVDMRRQHESKGEKIFSNILEKCVRESLAKKEQVMLLLNRRGFSTYLHCVSCGFVMQCEHCRISLTYHYDKGALICHVCHFRSSPQRLCPACQKNYLHYFGIGTQKVESEAARLFLGARLGRMDSDSMSKKDSHENILQAFKNRQIDILIGTQMIAKGHDFPNVSLIGVISADTALHLPDFRAAERTFDLLTQVAGRAGRGDIPGKVIVQTYLPHHYSIQSAKDHNYHEFYDKEIVYRKELQLPPFTHLIKVVVSGSSEKEVMRQIVSLCKLIESKIDHKIFKILGPAPAMISKERGQFKWNFYFKGPSVSELAPVLSLAIKEVKLRKAQITIDVDPQ